MEAFDFQAKQCYTYSRNFADQGSNDVIFADGRIALTWRRITDLRSNSNIGQAMFDYGIAPPPMGPRANNYAVSHFNFDSIVFQKCNKDLGVVIPIINEWASVFNNDGWRERYDDGRLRNDANAEMFFEYIVPNYVPNPIKLSDQVFRMCDAILMAVSYGGYTAAEAVEDYDDMVIEAIEAFGKAFRNIRQYTANFAFSTWLFKIASNNAIDFMRKKKLNNVSIDETLRDTDAIPVNIRSEQPTPEESLISEQKIVMLRSIVAKLKPRYRKLVELRYFYEYSYEEISEEMELPIGTVKAQLFRARELLQNVLKDKDGQFQP